MSGHVPALLRDTHRPLVLLGTGGSVRHAPWDDSDCVFWGKSYMIPKLPRVDVAFEMHSPPKCFDEGHLGCCTEPVTIPLVMQRPHAAWPTSIPFPLEAATYVFTPRGRTKPFLTSTASYMLALALLQEHLPREIRLYGIDMAQNFEYREQRPSVEYLLGIALGMGIPIYLAETSEVLKAPFLYGYEDDARLEALRDLRERQKHFLAQRDQAIVSEQLARRRAHECEGAIDAIEADIRRAQL